MQSVEYRTAGALALGLGGLVVAASMLMSQQRPADAVPAFAAQTGQPCTACHIGGFGPQLTPFGRAFKIGGYTQGGGTGWEAHMPLSGMLQGSFTNTAKDAATPQHTYGNNNNFAFDQASIFVAGRVSDHTGGFVQMTYSNVDNRTASNTDANGNPIYNTNGVSVDNTDLRPYTTTVQAFGNDLTLGLSVNNNPTVQDPYNSTFAWGYPYFSPKLAPGPTAGTILSSAAGQGGGPNFAGNVIGVTAYAWYNEHLYVEAGGYESMSNWLATRFGVGGGPISKGVMPYARAAYEWDWGNNAAWVGGTFMGATVDPGFTKGNDSYYDYALDGGYEFLGTGENIVTVQGIFVHEQQDLSGTTANYNTNHNTALGSSYGLNTVGVNVSYWYKNTYGVTAGWQNIFGQNNLPQYNSINTSGSPNSNEFTLEADWVPFGQDKSLWRPWANLKLGVGYNIFTQVDGVTSGASNNNTFYLFAWTAF